MSTKESTIDNYRGPFEHDDDDDEMPSWINNYASIDEIVDEIIYVLDNSGYCFSISGVSDLTFHELIDKGVFASKNKIIEVFEEYLLDNSDKYVLIDRKKGMYSYAETASFGAKDMEILEKAIANIFTAFKYSSIITLDKLIDRIEHGKRTKNLDYLIRKTNIFYSLLEKKLGNTYDFFGGKYICKKELDPFIKDWISSTDEYDEDSDSDDIVIWDFIIKHSTVSVVEIGDFRSAMMLSYGRTFLELIEELVGDYILISNDTITRKENITPLPKTSEKIVDVINEFGDFVDAKTVLTRIMIYHPEIISDIEKFGYKINPYFLVGIVECFYRDKVLIKKDSQDYRKVTYYLRGRKDETKRSQGFTFDD